MGVPDFDELTWDEQNHTAALLDGALLVIVLRGWRNHRLCTAGSACDQDDPSTAVCALCAVDMVAAQRLRRETTADGFPADHGTRVEQLMHQYHRMLAYARHLLGDAFTDLPDTHCSCHHHLEHMQTVTSRLAEQIRLHATPRKEPVTP